MDRQEAQDRQDIRARRQESFAVELTIDIKPLVLPTFSDGPDGRKMGTKTMWQLHRVDDIEWTPDDSGVYVLISWDLLTGSVRLDVLRQADNTPLVSFAGRADNVRKAAMAWFEARISQKAGLGMSLEHASYIGAELERADTERIDYVQD